MSNLDQVRVLADIPRLHRAVRPDRVAMVYQGRSITFAELDARASRAANALIAEGVAPQARVAFLDKNSDSYFELLFGAAKANAAMVALNWRLAPQEIAYIINDSAAAILFVGEEYFPHVEAVRDQLTFVRKIIALNGTRDGWEPYESWRDGQSDIDPMVPADGEDVAMQLYTSGTTGLPKGAMLTNNNFITLLPTALAEWGDWSDEDVNLVCMPVFHISGSGWALVGLYSGARSVILREVVCAEILRLIPEQRVTKALFVPAVLLFLLQTSGVGETDFSTLKLVAYGASPIPLDLLRKSMKTFNCDFAQVYGLTETTGAITYLAPEDHDPNGSPRMLSCGKPMSRVEVRVVGADGESLPPGEVGEIICRSAQNMKGYWNLPSETAQAIDGEWFHTGDAGYLDADGYLYIYDRLKDMIVSGGENIYPAEVESAIFAHTAVADVAVIGVPDDKWGEAVKALVVKKSGADVTADEIIEFTRERIAKYKTPRSVDFVESLPRNASGKILKRELRAPFWAGRERQVN